MLDLSHKLDDELIIGTKKYKLDLTYDNVLRMFELFEDKEIENHVKVYTALFILTRSEDFYKYDINDAILIFDSILEEHIKNKNFNSIEYDLAGNPMPVREEEQERLYSLKYDADYIFASFFQAYHIDLIEKQGSLHWRKFNALLNGLPKDTKFVEVVQIRSWKPRKSDSSEYKAEMRELQARYELPTDD